MIIPRGVSGVNYAGTKCKKFIKIRHDTTLTGIYSFPVNRNLLDIPLFQQKI